MWTEALHVSTYRVACKNKQHLTRHVLLRYAGVQGGSRCFCGATYGRHGPSVQCRTPCARDPGQNCGGSNANVVYSTDVGGAADLTFFWKVPFKLYNLSFTSSRPSKDAEATFQGHEQSLPGLGSTRRFSPERHLGLSCDGGICLVVRQDGTIQHLKKHKPATVRSRSTSIMLDLCSCAEPLEKASRCLSARPELSASYLGPSTM